MKNLNLDDLKLIRSKFNEILNAYDLEIETECLKNHKSFTGKDQQVLVSFLKEKVKVPVQKYKDVDRYFALIDESEDADTYGQFYVLNKNGSLYEVSENKKIGKHKAQEIMKEGIEVRQIDDTEKVKNSLLKQSIFAYSVEYGVVYNGVIEKFNKDKTKAKVYTADIEDLYQIFKIEHLYIRI